MAAKGKVEVEIHGKDKASREFGKAGNSLKKLGAIATGIGVIGAVGFGMMVKAAAEFEGKMREVNSMIGLSEKELAGFSKEVQSVAKEVGKSSTEMAGAMYQIVSAGIDSADAIDVLSIAAKAAVAGVTDVSTAADGLTTVLNAFKIPASEAQRVADVLFTTVKGGKTTFEELSASLFQVAPMAATAGVQFEVVAAALATMTKQGVPTSVATTQLRQAIQAIIKPTADMSAALEEIGYASGEALLAEQGFEAGIGLLVDAAGGSLETLGKMFGSVEGLSAVLALTGDNAAIFSEDIAKAMDSAGAATEAYDEINKGAGRQFEILTNKIKITGEEIGAILMPILINLMEKVSAVVDKVVDWTKKHPELTKAIVIFGAAVTAIALVGGPLAMMSKQISGLIAIGVTFAKFIWSTLIPALARLVISFVATLAAMGPWGWAAIAGGLAAAAAGIAAFSGLLGGGGGGGGAGGGGGPPGPPTEAEARARGLDFQGGGIVPGPIGAPISIIAHGGEEFAGPGGFGGDTYNVNLPNYLGDQSEVVNWLREALLKIKSRNFTTGL